MIRAGFTDQLIAEHLILFSLHQLLQRGLIVEIMRLASRNIAEDQAVDDLLCGGEAAVHVAGRDHGLHGVGDDGIALAAAAVLLAVAEQQEAAEADRARRAGQIFLTDKIGADARQLALRPVRKAPVQIIRHDEAQNRVA